MAMIHVRETIRRRAVTAITVAVAAAALGSSIRPAPISAAVSRVGVTGHPAPVAAVLSARAQTHEGDGGAPGARTCLAPWRLVVTRVALQPGERAAVSHGTGMRWLVAESGPLQVEVPPDALPALLGEPVISLSLGSGDHFRVPEHATIVVHNRGATTGRLLAVALLEPETAAGWGDAGAASILAAHRWVTSVAATRVESESLIDLVLNDCR